MEDTFGKYLRLFGTLFFTFIGFILAFALLLLGIKLFFGVLSFIPWFSYVYLILIIMFPTALFVSVYIIYFKRTGAHPSTVVKVLSYFLFVVALFSWGFFFVRDLRVFFKYYYNSIEHYDTYNLLFLASNVGLIFFIGVLQALSSEKEKDWMEKARQRK